MIKNKNFRNVSFRSRSSLGGLGVRAFGNAAFDGWTFSNGGGSPSIITSSIYRSSFPSDGVSGSVSRSIFDKIFLGRGSWSRRQNW